MFKKTISLLVITTFLYSSFLWACPVVTAKEHNPTSSETLAPDAKAILQDLLQKLRSAGVGDTNALAHQYRAYEIRGKIYREIVNAVFEADLEAGINEDKRLYLEALKIIISILFNTELDRAPEDPVNIVAARRVKDAKGQREELYLQDGRGNIIFIYLDGDGLLVSELLDDRGPESKDRRRFLIGLGLLSAGLAVAVLVGGLLRGLFSVSRKALMPAPDECVDTSGYLEGRLVLKQSLLKSYKGAQWASTRFNCNYNASAYGFLKLELSPQGNEPVNVRIQLLDTSTADGDPKAALGPFTVNPGEEKSEIYVPLARYAVAGVDLKRIRAIVIHYGEEDWGDTYKGKLNPHNDHVVEFADVSFEGPEAAIAVLTRTSEHYKRNVDTPLKGALQHPLTIVGLVAAAVIKLRESIREHKGLRDNQDPTANTEVKVWYFSALATILIGLGISFLGIDILLVCNPISACIILAGTFFISNFVLATIDKIHRKHLERTARLAIGVTAVLAGCKSATDRAESGSSSGPGSGKQGADPQSPGADRKQLGSSPSGKNVKLARDFNTYLNAHTNSQTGLPYSHIGDDRLQYWSFTYDAAMVANSYIVTGQLDRAKKIFDYYISRRGIWKSGGIITCVEGSNNRSAGQGKEWRIHTGPNAFLAIAAAHYYERTKDRRYLEFAEKLAGFIMRLQNRSSRDPNFKGGVRMGPNGRSAAYHFDWNTSNIKFYNAYCAEHNVDCYALFDILHKITRKSKYQNSARMVADWLKNIYDRKRHALMWGTYERTYTDPDTRGRVSAGIDRRIPLDANTWAVSALGPELLEEFEPGAAGKILQMVDDRFVNTDTVSLPSGKRAEVTGVDYVERDYARSQLGRDPMVSFEWTCEQANAHLRVGDRARHRQILDGILPGADKADGGLGFPYASRYFAKVGWGWRTPKAGLSTIGGAYEIMSLLEADPLLPEFGSSAQFQEFGTGKSAPAVRDEDRPEPKIKTTTEEYVLAAWLAYKRGQYRLAMKKVNQMFREHPDWLTEAKRMNRGLSDFPQPIPNNQAVHNYWAVNDIGTGYYIIIKCLDMLGELRVGGGFNREAVKAARAIVNDYTYSQCWDPKGWFWQPVISMQKEYPGLYAHVTGGRDPLAVPARRPSGRAPTPAPGDGRREPAREERAPRPSAGDRVLRGSSGQDQRPNSWASRWIDGNWDLSGYKSLKLTLRGNGNVRIQLVKNRRRDAGSPMGLYEEKYSISGTTPISIPLSRFGLSDLSHIERIVVHQGANTWNNPLNDSNKHIEIIQISASQDKGARLTPTEEKRIKYARAIGLDTSFIDYDPALIEQADEAEAALASGRYKDASGLAGKVLANTDWTNAAYRQQRQKIGLGGLLYTQTQDANPCDPIEMRFWALNNVCRALVTMAKAEFMQGERQQALAVVDCMVTNYSLAQIYDTESGCFWNPVNDMLSRREGSPVQMFCGMFDIIEREGTIPMLHFDPDRRQSVFAFVRSLVTEYEEAAASLDDPEPPTDIGVAAKAWSEDQVEHLAEIVRAVWGEAKPSLTEEHDGTVFYIQESVINQTIEVEGVSYKVSYTPGDSHFQISETKDGITTEKKLFMIPLGETEVVIPRGLSAEIVGLARELRIYKQGGLHERIEAADPAKRIAIFSSYYTQLEESDRSYVKRLLSKLGIKMIIEGDEIKGFESDLPGHLLPHCLAEVAELMVEYLEDKDRYGSLSNVSLSSLDASLLGVRLNEITEAGFDLDDFVEKVTDPEFSPRRIVLSMAGEGRLDLETIKGASEAVRLAMSGVAHIHFKRPESDIVFVLADKLTWRNQTKKTLSEMLGRSLYDKMDAGARENGFERQWGLIEGLLLDIRQELTRIRDGSDKLNISNIYLHTLISRISHMAGVRARDVIKAFYGDLIQGEDEPNVYKLRQAAIETAVVEAEQGTKRGLMAYSGLVHCDVNQNVRELAVHIFKERIKVDEEAKVHNVSDICLDILDKGTDPFGVMEELFAESDLGRVGCRKGTLDRTLTNLAEFVEVRSRTLSAAQQLLDSSPKELAKTSKKEEVVISLNAIMDVEGYDSESKKLTVNPKGIGIKKVLQALPQGKEVRIIDFQKDRIESMLRDHVPADLLEEFAKKAIEECLDNVFGMRLSEFSDLTLESDSLDNVIDALGPGDKTLVVITEGDKPERELTISYNTLLYVLRPEELLVNAIGVLVNVEFDEEGKLKEESKALLKSYYKRSLPKRGISFADTTLEDAIDEYLDEYCLIDSSCTYFQLPEAVRLSDKLEEISSYRMLIDLST